MDQAISFPKRLHSTIVQKAFFERFKIPMALLSFLLGVNVIVSVWHIWNKLVGMETFAVLQELWEEFEISRDFLQEFINVAPQIIPLYSIVVFLINAFLLSYLLFLWFKWKA